MEARAGSGLPQQELRSDNLRFQEPILGIPLVSDSPGTNAATSNQWPPYHNPPSSSSRSRPLDYLSHHAAHMANQQDAWNPLQVTGVPAQAAGYVQPFNKSYQGTDIDGRYSSFQHSPTSEIDGKYNTFNSSDSGYGSKSGKASSVATSFAVNSSFGTQTSSNEYEQAECASAFEQSVAPYGDGSSDTAHLSEQLSCFYQELRCDYPGCEWVGKCPSDKRCVSGNSATITRLIAIGNMTRDTKRCSGAMRRTALGKTALGPSTTLRDTRNAYITKSQSVARRRSTCALRRTVLVGAKNGRVSITSASILFGCMAVNTQMSC